MYSAYVCYILMHQFTSGEMRCKGAAQIQNIWSVLSFFLIDSLSETESSKKIIPGFFIKP